MKQWIEFAAGYRGRHIELGVFELAENDGFLDLDFQARPVDPGPAEAGYDYSKLYYACAPGQGYDESRTICFRIRYTDRCELHRLVIPQEARRSGYIRMRLDAVPYNRGWVRVRRIGTCHVDDRSPESLKALRWQLKQETRAGVEQSEATGRYRLPHMPESISLELTAGCNLTCSHCSSHGLAKEHARNNRRKPFDLAMLDRLAADAFPALTLLNLVGRGEPMMVGLPLWGKLIGHLDRYDVLMTCVTNGTFLRRRIDERTLPVIDTLTVSIDGTSPEVFAANRGNASLDEWKRNVGYFNELRHASKLARKPRLGLSWTLKRNNIAQFPDFVRLAMDLGADLLYVRHLFVFHAKDQDQSLVSEPDLANRFLKEGYDLLQGRSIKLDAAPLSYTDASA